jgi:hypothetical protein
LDLDITLHHNDGDHDNNNPRNLTPSHSTCHKTHHAHEVFRAWRAA